MPTITQVQPTTNEVLSNGVIGYKNSSFQLQDKVFPVIDVN